MKSKFRIAVLCGIGAFCALLCYSFYLKSNDDRGSTPQEIVKWYKDEAHGYAVERKFGDMSYTAQWKTPDFLNAVATAQNNEVGPELSFDDFTVMELAIENKSFKDELIKYNLSDMQEYQARVQYLSYRLKQDVLLVNGSDTLSCLEGHWERAFDAVPRVAIQIMFPAIKKDLPTTLIYHDRLFGNGPIKFKFLQ